MPAREYFRWHPEVRGAVKAHVHGVIEGLDPRRFAQEDAYTAALAGRLVGTAYEGPQGRIRFDATIPTSAGRGSAERLFGADVAIVATLAQGARTVRKAMLAQAKRGEVESLSQRELNRLKEQLRRMTEVVPAPKILEVPREPGMDVYVRSGRKVLASEPASSIRLGSYFTRYVLTCIEGDTSPRTIAGVEESRMTTVRISASRKQ